MIGPTVLAPMGVFPGVCEMAGAALTAWRAGERIYLGTVSRAGVLTLGDSFVVVAGGADSTFPVLLTWRSRQWIIYRRIEDNGANLAALREVTNAVAGPEIILDTNPIHPIIGNDPVACSNDGWIGWQRADGSGVWGVNMADLSLPPVHLSTRYAPTGLAYLADGGAPVYTDDNRGSVAGMDNPARAGGAIVGEGLNGGIAVQLAGRTGELLPGTTCDTPKVADLGGGLYAAVTWGDSVRAVLFTADDVRPALTLVPSINRFCLFGWFAYGDVGDAPGNCLLLVNAAMHVVARDNGEVLGTFVEGSPDGDVAAVERAIAAERAAEPTLAVIAYWTAAAQAVRIPAGAQVYGVELYPRLMESLAAAEQRVRASIAVCPAAVLVVQAFSSNASLTTDLTGVLAIAARIARDCRNVLGLLLFSAGGGRPSGYNDHPELHTTYAEVFASVLGPAVLPRPPAATPMPVPPPVPVPVPRPAPIPQPPASPFGDVRPYEVAPMDPQIVGLIGPGGKFASVNKVTKQLTFDKTAVGIDEQFELSKPDDRFQIKNIGTGLIVGIDVTQYGSNDLRKLFTLHNPATQPRGNYESFFVGKTPNGLILAFIEYISQGAIVGAFASPALTVVPQ